MTTSYKTLVKTKSKRPAIAKLRHQVLKHFNKGGKGQTPYLTAGDKQIEIPLEVLLDEAKWMAFVKKASEDYQAAQGIPTVVEADWSAFLNRTEKTPDGEGETAGQEMAEEV